MTTFAELGINKQLLAAVNRLGFTTPTEIQRLAIPHIIKEKDVIGESATGSGKTLAFGCSIIEHVQPKKGLQSLVLAPTRELAEQVKDALREFASDKDLRINAVYGGVAFDPQVHQARRSEVIVATPGRMLDHLRRGTIDTSKVKILIVDEADRMFDMGFIDDVEQIIQACPRKRQTLFFSATISDRILKLGQRHLNQPEIVYAKKQVDPSKLKQIYYDVQKNMKFSLLAHLLQDEQSGLVMVFCNTRRTTDFVTDNLSSNGVNAIAIHGGLTQNKRMKSLKTFNSGKTAVLVCTDVAARGLHIDNVSHVYNYDLPNDPKEYVHRIGRTARAGEEGKVINLLSDHDYDSFARILRGYSNFKVDNVETPEVKRIQIRMAPRNNNFDRPRNGYRHKSGQRAGNRGDYRKPYRQKAPYRE